MSKFALAALAAVALGAAATSPAYARITANGPQLTGIALTLPFGETVDLRKVERVASRR